MTEPYEGREERDWQEDEDQPEDEEDEYDGPWAIYLDHDANTNWERTPANRKALASGMPHEGDVRVGTTMNDVRGAKGLALSKAMNGFDGRAGEFSRELLGDDTRLDFDAKNSNRKPLVLREPLLRAEGVREY